MYEYCARSGWVLYDGECPLCVGLATRLEPLVRRRGFALSALQTPWVQERLGLRPGEPLAEMRVLTAGGDPLGGADALLYVARRIWWAWPLYAVGRLPMVMPLLRRAYGWIAGRRDCINGACRVPRRSGALGDDAGC